MAQVILELDKLGELDMGMAKAAINAELDRLAADLDDRGDDEKKRKVVITITAQQRKGLVTLNVEAACKLPPRRTADTVARPMRTTGSKSVIVFQEDAPENPDQTTFEFDRKSQDGERS